MVIFKNARAIVHFAGVVVVVGVGFYVEQPGVKMVIKIYSVHESWTHSLSLELKFGDTEYESEKEC